MKAHGISVPHAVPLGACDLCSLFFYVKSLGYTSHPWVGYKGRSYSCCTVNKYVTTVDCNFLVNHALFSTGWEDLFSLNSSSFIRECYSVSDFAAIT